jgi:hypothetical protein
VSARDKLLAMTLSATERLGAPRADGTTETERITAAIATEVATAVKDVVRARHRSLARTPAGARDPFPDLVHQAIVAMLERIQKIGEAPR